MTNRNINLWIIIVLILVQGCAKNKDAITPSTEGNEIYLRVESSKIRWDVIGESVEGRDIYKADYGKGDSLTLIIGGFHGAEIRGAELALTFAEYLNAQKDLELKERVIIIPVLNPDGLIRQERLNAHGVDINRNFPTKNWTSEARGPRYNPGTAPASEPETKLIMAMLDQYQPQRIISIHSPLEMVNYDGPGRDLAEKMAVHTGYPVSGDIGYPTPGSFGNYAGVEKNIPTITLELPHGSFASMWEANRDALLAAIRFVEH
ncbi:MAG: M14 family murein peptide amidase A [Rhodothermales bacterium]